MILYYEQLDSTNQHAKALLTTHQVTPGVVICAWRQSAGKGQHGRSFASPHGGLYFSVIASPALAQTDFPLITLAVGLACREVLSANGQVDIRIKWPNDLYIADRKVAGILCETVPHIEGTAIQPVVIIGVGINVNNSTSDFPDEIQPLITTLREQTSVRFALSELLNALILSINRQILELDQAKLNVLRQWQQYDLFYKRSLIATLPTSSITGQGLGIDMDGRYRLRDADGVEHALIGGQLRLLSPVSL